MRRGGRAEEVASRRKASNPDGWVRTTLRNPSPSPIPGTLRCGFHLVCRPGAASGEVKKCPVLGRWAFSVSHSPTPPNSRFQRLSRGALRGGLACPWSTDVSLEHLCYWRAANTSLLTDPRLRSRQTVFQQISKGKKLQPPRRPRLSRSGPFSSRFLLPSPAHSAARRPRSTNKRRRVKRRRCGASKLWPSGLGGRRGALARPRLLPNG